jgi:hypothetical protein
LWKQILQADIVNQRAHEPPMVNAYVGDVIFIDNVNKSPLRPLEESPSRIETVQRLAQEWVKKTTKGVE